MCGVYSEIGMYFPIKNKKLSNEQKADLFVKWCSGYYNPLPSSAPITTETLQACTLIAERGHTLYSLSHKEQEQSIDPRVLYGSALILTTEDEIRQRNARRTLLDVDAVLPEVDVVLLWADLSVFLCLCGVKVLNELLEEEPAEGKRKRKVSVLKLENMNHFISTHSAWLCLMVTILSVPLG